jgi:hypothetical protein
VYVDDILLYAKSQDIIDSYIGKLKEDKIWIRKEGSTEGFLGVDKSRCLVGVLSSPRDEILV